MKGIVKVIYDITRLILCGYTLKEIYKKLK